MNTTASGAQDRWTTEWPTAPGDYWFYGWCFRNRKHVAELNFVKARPTRNSLCLVTNGHFLYREEGGYGMWLSARLPYLPELPPEEEVT